MNQLSESELVEIQSQKVSNESPDLMETASLSESLHSSSGNERENIQIDENQNVGHHSQKPKGDDIMDTIISQKSPSRSDATLKISLPLSEESDESDIDAIVISTKPQSSDRRSARKSINNNRILSSDEEDNFIQVPRSKNRGKSTGLSPPKPRIVDSDEDSSLQRRKSPTTKKQHTSSAQRHLLAFLDVSDDEEPALNRKSVLRQRKFKPQVVKTYSRFAEVADSSDSEEDQNNHGGSVPKPKLGIYDQVQALQDDDEDKREDGKVNSSDEEDDESLLDEDEEERILKRATNTFDAEQDEEEAGSKPKKGERKPLDLDVSDDDSILDFSIHEAANAAKTSDKEASKVTPAKPKLATRQADLDGFIVDDSDPDLQNDGPSTAYQHTALDNLAHGLAQGTVDDLDPRNTNLADLIRESNRMVQKEPLTFKKHEHKPERSTRESLALLKEEQQKAFQRRKQQHQSEQMKHRAAQLAGAPRSLITAYEHVLSDKILHSNGLKSASAEAKPTEDDEDECKLVILIPKKKHSAIKVRKGLRQALTEEARKRAILGMPGNDTEDDEQDDSDAGSQGMQVSDPEDEDEDENGASSQDGEDIDDEDDEEEIGIDVDDEMDNEERLESHDAAKSVNSDPEDGDEMSQIHEEAMAKRRKPHAGDTSAKDSSKAQLDDEDDLLAPILNLPIASPVRSQTDKLMDKGKSEHEDTLSSHASLAVKDHMAVEESNAAEKAKELVEPVDVIVEKMHDDHSSRNQGVGDPKDNTDTIKQLPEHNTLALVIASDGQEDTPEQQPPGIITYATKDRIARINLIDDEAEDSAADGYQSDDANGVEEKQEAKKRKRSSRSDGEDGDESDPGSINDFVVATEDVHETIDAADQANIYRHKILESQNRQMLKDLDPASRFTSRFGRRDSKLRNQAIFDQHQEEGAYQIASRKQSHHENMSKHAESEDPKVEHAMNLEKPDQERYCKQDRQKTAFVLELSSDESEDSDGNEKRKTEAAKVWKKRQVEQQKRKENVLKAKTGSAYPEPVLGALGPQAAESARQVDYCVQNAASRKRSRIGAGLSMWNKR